MSGSLTQCLYATDQGNSMFFDPRTEKMIMRRSRGFVYGAKKRPKGFTGTQFNKKRRIESSEGETSSTGTTSLVSETIKRQLVEVFWVIPVPPLQLPLPQ